MSRILRAIGRALMVGLTGAGIAAGGRCWHGYHRVDQPAPLRDEPPAAHPDKIVPLKSLPLPEAGWWHELERRLK